MPRHTPCHGGTGPVLTSRFERIRVSERFFGLTETWRLVKLLLSSLSRGPRGMATTQ